MNIEALTPKQGSGILTVRLVGTPAKYKAQFVDTEWLPSPALCMQT